MLGRVDSVRRMDVHMLISKLEGFDCNGRKPRQMLELVWGRAGEEGLNRPQVTLVTGDISTTVTIGPWWLLRGSN